jgi:hypothetical protein
MHQNFANYKKNYLPTSKIKATNQNFKLQTASGGGTPKPRTPRFASCVSQKHIHTINLELSIHFL